MLHVDMFICDKYILMYARNLARVKCYGHWLPTFLFSQKKISVEKQILNKLLHNTHKYNAMTIVQMIRYVQEKQLHLSGENYQHVLSSLSSISHQLDHHHLTLLLESLHNTEDYREYKRSLPIFKNLMKRLNSIKSVRLNNQYIFPFFNYLQLMKFPPVMVIKFLHSLDTSYFKKGNEVIPPLHALKILLLVLEPKYIPITLTQTFLSPIITNYKFNTLMQYAYLYHIGTMIGDMVKGKVEHQMQKKNMYDVVYNPWTTVAQNTNDKQPEEEKSNSEEETRKEMEEQGKKIMKIWEQKVDGKQVQNTVMEIMANSEEELTIEAALILSSLPSMQPYLLQFLNDNLTEFTPTELITIVSSQPLPQRLPLINTYQESKKLSLKQRLQLLEGINRICNIPLSPKVLNEILQSHAPTWADWPYLQQFIITHMPEAQWSRILQAVESSLEEKK